jgi:hypothetical protein
VLIEETVGNASVNGAPPPDRPTASHDLEQRAYDDTGHGAARGATLSLDR